MLSRTINVEREFVSNGLSPSASQWYSAQHRALQKKKKKCLSPIWTIVLNGKNIQNNTGVYIQAWPSVLCWIYGQVAITRPSCLHVCHILCCLNGAWWSPNSLAAVILCCWLINLFVVIAENHLHLFLMVYKMMYYTSIYAAWMWIQTKWYYLNAWHSSRNLINYICTQTII